VTLLDEERTKGPPSGRGTRPDRWLLDVIDRPELRSSVTSRELTEAFLARIATWQDRINAYFTVTPELALRQAEAVDAAARQGERIGPLHGLVVGVKDDIDLAGVPCRVGSSFLRDNVPDQDAAVVRRLRAAGAIFPGKLGLSEFALGSTCDNVHYGRVANPWDPARYPGGSSGGSGAALAADLCVAALGSDAGGSIRIPAALCGVSGLRPTQGSVPAQGSHVISWSTETIGSMARSARDVARLYDAIRTPSNSLPAGALDGLIADREVDLRGVRVGVPAHYFFDGVDADVAAAVRSLVDQLALLGADVREVRLPGADATVEACKYMILADAYAIQRERLEEAPELFGDEVRERLLLGRDVSGARIARYYEDARTFTRQLDFAFDDVDLVVTPTVGFVAQPAEGARMLEETTRLSLLTVPFSVTGVPAMSIPCGLSDDEGLPIGAQIVGARGRDDLVLSAAVAYQDATDWHRRRPEAPGEVPG
jgi:aspartyl-tRNA(Asn)/glutamyl-tRNA(Gln) amidotransferase subunit A